MEEGTGAGIYCEELGMEISIPLGISATVFQSEIVAIETSCCALIERQTTGKRVLI